MALRQDVPLSGAPARDRPDHGRDHRRSSCAGPSRCSGRCSGKIDRINLVMRETLAGRPRHPRLRAHRPRGGALRRGQPRPVRTRRSAVNRLFAITMPALMADHEPVAPSRSCGSAPSASTAAAMPIGNLTAFLQYIIQILFAIMMAVFMFVMVPRAAGLRRPDPRGPRHRAVDPRPGRRRSRPPRTGQRRVPRRRVPLPGRRGAGPARHLVRGRARARRRPSSGSTGSGKSTLINLLPRFYDVDRRRGPRRRRRRPRRWTARTSGARIGIVPQRAFLFSGTVASNLRYGDEAATDDDLWHALEIAQGRDFVEEMPERPRGADHPGRHQRLGRPAPAPGDRPGARQAARHLRLRRQLLGPRLPDRRPAAGRARAASWPTRR